MTKNRVHVFSNDALGELDAVSLATLIKKKELSSKEIINASIERAKKADPSINAVITDCYDSALTASKKQKNGFFAGLPIFIKDMTLVKGLPTYYGSEAFTNTKPSKKTDPIVKQILAQGFINLGTSSMPEFGFTGSTEFEATHQKDTCNPWNIKHTAGGSSGGAAALVASGVVPLAHGSDGGGSIRIPAACCGLVGLKSTRGRLLKSSMSEGSVVDIAVDGILSRSVRDTAYFFGEAEKYYKNPKLLPIGLITNPSKRKYKIGYTGNSVKALKADETNMTALNNTALLLESLGHEVKLIKMPIPDQFEEDFINLWAFSAFMCSNFGKLLFSEQFDKSKLTKFTVGLANHFSNNKLNTMFSLIRLRGLHHEYKKIFSDLDIDIFLTPTTSTTATELGYLGMHHDFEEFLPKLGAWACFTPYANAAGGPSISLPMGHDLKKDLPIGMQFMAKHGEEKILLDIAYQLEEAQPWKKITDL